MHHRSTEVLGMRTFAYKFPSGRKLTRMPHLASPLLRINLAEELRRLRSEQSWKRGSGRSSKTLAKYPDFHMVLVLMKAKTQMHKHHVDARISIQALEGRLRVRLTDQVVEITAGELIALDYARSEEHTSELQSRVDLVCRLLLEKKKIKEKQNSIIYTKTKQANRNSEEK